MFENTLIEFVENCKNLGLTLSNTGKWNCHIDNLAKASSKILGIMRKRKYTLSKANLYFICFGIFFCCLGRLF